MTRKHFQLIADALVEANATIEQVKVIAKQQNNENTEKLEKILLDQ